MRLRIDIVDVIYDNYYRGIVDGRNQGGSVKLPDKTVIPRDKLLRYLLLPREENDKSKFLASAGYTLANWEVLERELHQLSRTCEVSNLETSPFGIMYEVRGTLTGPNARTLDVVTIWIKLEATSETRFVTLFPHREVTRSK
jgi:hypothetical protein